MRKVTFIVLKPRPGKTEELIALLKRSNMILQQLNIALQKDQILAMSSNGTIIQIFEWTSERSLELATEHEEVRELWAEAEKLSDFQKPSSLQEFQEMFPSLNIIS